MKPVANVCSCVSRHCRAHLQEKKSIQSLYLNREGLQISKREERTKSKHACKTWGLIINSICRIECIEKHPKHMVFLFKTWVDCFLQDRIVWTTHKYKSCFSKSSVTVPSRKSQQRSRKSVFIFHLIINNLFTLTLQLFLSKDILITKSKRSRWISFSSQFW